MSAPDEPPLPRGQPNGDLLLAQALDACIEAERRRRGSSAAIIARQPEAARVELRRLMHTVRALEGERSRAMPSVTFRAEARARLMRRIGGASDVPYAEPRPVGGARPFTPSGPGSEARTRWLLRSMAGLVAAAAATAAAVGVSASALPGDALYGFKQAREELSLRLASDDEQRLQALLQRGDARLDETARLIELGRTTEAARTVQRFDAVVEHATTTMVETTDVGHVEPVHGEALETKLDEQHERLLRILEVAPQPARDDLHDVLRVATLDRELAVEPRPADRPATRRSSRAPSAEPPPPVSAGRASDRAGEAARSGSQPSRAPQATDAPRR